MKRRIGSWLGCRLGGTFGGTKLLAIVLAWTAGAQARPRVDIAPPVEPGLRDEAVPTSLSGEVHLLASDGKRWLSVYPGTLDWAQLAVGRLIGADGKPAGSPFVIDYHLIPQDLVYDGTDYVVFGLCESRICFTRVKPNGEPDGRVDILSSRVTPGLTLKAAVGGDGQLLVVGCETGHQCASYMIDDQDELHRLPRALPILSIGQIVYSSGRFLLLSFDAESPGSDIFESSMLQLDEHGLVVDGTAKSLGKQSDFPDLRVAWAAPATGGFALAIEAWPGLDLAKIDLNGAIEAKGHYPPDGYARAPTLAATSTGYLLLAHGDQEDVVQALDPNLTTVGDALHLPETFVPTLAAGPEGKALTCRSGPEALEAQLIEVTSPLVASDPFNVSIAPVGQRSVFVSPAPEGWFLAWNALGRGSADWHYARLDEHGLLAGKPQALDAMPGFFGWGLQSVNRGPSGWLFAADTCVGQDLDEDDSPCTVELALVPDSGKPHGVPGLGPMEYPGWTPTDLSGFSIAGSEQGFVVVWSATAELHATRLDAQGASIGDVVLSSKPRGRLPVAAAVEGDHYRVFWWDAASQRIASRELPFTGDAPSGDPTVSGKRADVTDMAAVCSSDGCWLLGESLCSDPACLLSNSPPLAKTSWFLPQNEAARELPADSSGALVSTPGVALAALSDAQHESFPPIQLGIAEQGQSLEIIHSFEGGTQPRLAAKSDGSALLAYLHVSTAEGAPSTRIVTSLIHVSSDDIDEGGAGGAPTTSTDDPAGSGGEPPASGEARAGEGGEMSDSTKPGTVGGGGCDCAVTHPESSRLGWLAPLAWLLRRRRRPARPLAPAQRPSA